MDVRTRHLAVTRTARYAESGDPATARSLWYLFHGYGQLAPDFLASCAALSAGHRVLVAPEGLSRFYTRGVSESPGASWMTREDRDHEIADQGSYLESLHERVVAGLERPPERVFLLGFSQGATTADRWAATSPTPDPAAVILWGGSPAMDLASDVRVTRRVVFVHGDADPYFTAKAYDRVSGLYAGRSQPFETHTFVGGHVMDGKTLARLAAKLDP